MHFISDDTQFHNRPINAFIHPPPPTHPPINPPTRAHTHSRTSTHPPTNSATRSPTHSLQQARARAGQHPGSGVRDGVCEPGGGGPASRGLPERGGGREGRPPPPTRPRGPCLEIITPLCCCVVLRVRLNGFSWRFSSFSCFWSPACADLFCVFLSVFLWWRVLSHSPQVFMFASHIELAPFLSRPVACPSVLADLALSNLSQ